MTDLHRMKTICIFITNNYIAATANLTKGRFLELAFPIGNLPRRERFSVSMISDMMCITLL